MIDALKDYLRLVGAKATLSAFAMACAWMGNNAYLKAKGRDDQWRELAGKLRILADELPEGL